MTIDFASDPSTSDLAPAGHWLSSRSAPLSLSDLPSIDPARLALHNALHVARRPLAFDWYGRAASLHLLPDTADIPEACKIAIRVGKTSVVLSGSARAFDRLGQHPDRRRTLDEVDPELAAMWLEVVWLEWLEPLEATLGADIRLAPSPPVLSEPTMRVSVVFQLGDESHPLALDLPLSAAEMLLPLFDRAFVAEPAPANAVVATLRVETGEQTLTLGEWRSLRPGDMVMLEAAAADEARLNLADRFGCRIRFHETGLRLSEPLQRMTPRPVPSAPREARAIETPDVTATHEDEDTVDNETSTAPPEPGVDKTTLADRDRNDSSLKNETAIGSNVNGADMNGADINGAGVNDLPVRLTCELGRLEMSLGELRQLGEGSVLPLQRRPDQAVDLVVNGRTMGRGRLVAIGDAIGVQIERLALGEGRAGDD
ncbi:type III secretion system cytoplasmic ring protein SctQ [Salinicola socius]|uniref:Flagellar motor switch protein FliN-like C-terminal domain-containing protein n=1 Tax=Salinicola socius TaxID=404433 RepID=A0A1Q8SWQ3_9GAMM|nr:type III secretion system cytoplasmic ring protein SctQ [Salinicola socius]OLO05847.1 hypothetical protein BTW07_02585 [Salinicola socius]